MKYDIKVYVDGNHKGHEVNENKFNYNWLDRILKNLTGKYTRKGYTEIHNCRGGDNGYSVMFNEKLMKSVVISYRTEHLLDFNDIDGNPILAGKIYLGELQGEKISDDHTYDRYTISMDCCGKLYIRNITRTDQHIVWGDFPHMTKTIPDKFDFDQQYVDSLKLHSITK